jgi:nickel-dependent lactate racemase
MGNSMSYHKTPLKYGTVTIDEFIPSSVKKLTILRAAGYKPEFADFKVRLNEVLAKPLGSKPFDVLVKKLYSKGKRIVILVDDNTRPNIHTRVLLPILTARLLGLGVGKEDIAIMISSGTHGPPKPDAIENKVLGSEIYKDWKANVLTHDCDSGNRDVGKTKMGTPILIDQKVLDSSLIIVLSDSEYHYFAGQAGTVKLFCPGVAGCETVRVNHPRMFDLEKGFKPECRLGNTEGNPVIQDMIDITRQMAARIPIFCIDTIVDQGKIVYVQAGDIIECHKAASAPLRKLSVVDVDEPADIVFVSVGDLGINLYQAGKGIHAAWNGVRHDLKGWIVLLAPCQEGIGSSGYENSIKATQGMKVKDALKYCIEHDCSEKTFQIGNQKVPDLFRILLDVAERNIKVVTQLDPKMLSDIYRMEGLNPRNPADAQRVLLETMQRFLKENPDPRVFILDNAGLYISVKHQIAKK